MYVGYSEQVINPQFDPLNPDIEFNLIDRSDARGSQPAQADAAIELCETHPTGMSSLRVLSCVYRPYASPALLRRPGLTREDLPGLLKAVPCIRTSMANAWECWLRLAGLDGEVEPGLLTKGPAYAQASLALTAVISGMGVALLPGYVADECCNEGTIIRLSPIGWRANRSYHLQWNSDGTLKPGLRRFIDWAETIAVSELEALASTG